MDTARTENQHDPEINLGLPGFSYQDLYDPGKLAELLEVFHAFVDQRDPGLRQRFADYRAAPEGLPDTEVSELLVDMAPHLGDFLGRLFGIEAERERQAREILAERKDLLDFRKLLLDPLRKADAVEGTVPEAEAARESYAQWERVLDAAFPELPKEDRERTSALAGLRLLRLEERLRQAQDNVAQDPVPERAAAESLRQRLERASSAADFAPGVLSPEAVAALPAVLLGMLRRWCLAVLRQPQSFPEQRAWSLFRSPARRNPKQLVEHELVQHAGYSAWNHPGGPDKRRVGFSLSDHRYSERQVQYEVEHCIYCHRNNSDSCSHGMLNRRTKKYREDPFGKPNTGCPLGEKISEMHLLKRDGDDIGALALILIDNPMCPGTGHRICNDCMKGCIYQKTDPVDIPQVETHVLTGVLELPWGFEIYSLLTRWNPLNIQRPHALPFNGKKILVVGMGPAGYTLAHYLLNEGFSVVGIDALKIEPLPEELTAAGGTPRPVRRCADLYEALDKRVMAGFGGVAEYGITVRWDKNFLKLIYLNLVRNHKFRCYGGVRFGGTLLLEDAWKLGFDHIAIATGAGKPTLVDIRNNMLRGIRMASDFLMALQLTGAARQSSLANLQVRLPAGVIGGGLTAIDTATEVLAYYPIQVEKVLNRWERLERERGNTAQRAGYDDEEREILNEFLEHGRAVRAERERAAAAGERPDFVPLLRAWGGVTLFYRKDFRQAPSYRQNHEEVHEALREGIYIAEGMTPLEALEDEQGALRAVHFRREIVDAEGPPEQVEVPLRSLFVAAGTSPNTIYEQEHPYSLRMGENSFQRHEPVREQGRLVRLEPMHDTAHPKLGRPAPFTSYDQDGRYITFFGDNHPVYAGNVVKAMASARDGYPYIVQLFRADLEALRPEEQAAREQQLSEFFASLDHAWLAVVVQVRRLAPTIVEVVVRAPMQARKFKPGQFYRVQNLEAIAPTVRGTLLTTEGLALTGAGVDKERGLLSLIALEIGCSSRLCALWRPGDPLVVMGVTGTPTEIPRDQTCLLIGGGLGNAVLFSIGQALRAAGNRVLYFAGYRKPGDLFKIDQLEAAADTVVWSVDPAPGVRPPTPRRDSDRSYSGNIVQAIAAYGRGELGPQPIPLQEVDHLIVIGSDGMMAAVQQARYGSLKPWLKPQHSAIGSINSPMQCMMKGVCAQCLCKHLDPKTHEEYFVYSCYNQDQELDRVDFRNLRARLRQNSVQEKLSSLWLDWILEEARAEERLDTSAEPAGGVPVPPTESLQ